MSSIRKRTWKTSNGIEKTAWIVDYKDAAGARRSKQFARKKDAEAWRLSTADQVRKGLHTPDSQSITMSEACNLWLDRAVRENLEESTIAAYEQHVRIHILPICGNCRLSQITRPQAELWRDHLVRTLSHAMAKRVMRSISAVIEEALRRGYVAQNVCSGIVVKQSNRRQARLEIPTKRELQSIIGTSQKSSQHPMAHALLLTAIFTGLRASELRGLSWTDIDFEKAVLSVHQRADRKNILGPPKTSAGYRTISLPQQTLRCLRQWKLKCPPNQLNLVFPSVRGKIVSHGYLMKQIVRRVQIEANVVKEHKLADQSGGGCVAGDATISHKYGLHSFRHAAASLWIDQDLNPKRIQNWMGHSSIQVTLDIYGHLFADPEKDMAAAIATEEGLLGKLNAT